MINGNTIKCNNCSKQVTKTSNLKGWCTRLHVDRLATIYKHFCPACTKTYGFYANGISPIK